MPKAVATAAGRRRLWLVGIYVLLLALSHGLRSRSTPAVPEDRQIESVTAVDNGDRQPGATVDLAWVDWPLDARTATPGLPLVLLHGSPGDAANFRRLAPALAEYRRVIAVDLPGFGASSGSVPDYSIRAHADYVLQLLDRLGLDRVHVLGFSMGGGVVLHLWEMEPERIASVTLLSAIGVQELELLGNYRLNHMLHGLQVVPLWLLHEATPHMGILDGFPLDVAYARNFYDTDQRSLRGILERFEPPMLIIHGENDPLVPAAAALEHHRIVPQSELVMLPASHFFVFSNRHDLSTRLEHFLERVEDGTAVSRREAGPERVAASRRPFDPSSVPQWSGAALQVVMVLLALATLVSEDFTCIGAGLLVAQGRISFFAATLACFTGILVGDLALFWVGRIFGRRALRLPPLKWWVTQEALDEASVWLRRRGAAVIFLTRFLPGTRLPTYLAAGVLHTSFWKFTAYFVLAGVLWTPALVALSTALGEAGLARVEQLQYGLLIVGLLLVILMIVVRKVLLPLFTWRGRRLWLGRYKRWRHWEFWPMWMIYPPVVLYVLYLSVRHRCLTLFTAVNHPRDAGRRVRRRVEERDPGAVRRPSPECHPSLAAAAGRVVSGGWPAGGGSVPRGSRPALSGGAQAGRRATGYRGRSRPLDGRGRELLRAPSAADPAAGVRGRSRVRRVLLPAIRASPAAVSFPSPRSAIRRWLGTVPARSRS